MKQKKGVTLIALIVTIIVMLILAGVSINLILEDNGTVARSENAKIENLRAQVLDLIQNETKTAVNEFGEYDQKEAINNLKENYDTKITEIAVEVNGRLGIKFEEQGYEFNYVISNRGEVTAVSEYVCEKKVDGVYELLAPVPLGFVASDVKGTGTNEDSTKTVSVTNISGSTESALYYDGEDKIEYGLVIYEGDKKVDSSNIEEAKTTRNQFVWIPVNEDELNSLLVADENGDLYWYEKAVTPSAPLKHYTYVEPYYEIASYLNDDNKGKEVEWLKSIVGNNVTDEKELEKSFNAILRKAFDEVVESTKKFGGFYVARYETSLENSTNIVSKKGYLPNIEKSFFSLWNEQNKFIDNNDILSNMMFSFQWKLIEKFLKDKVINLSGNYDKFEIYDKEIYEEEKYGNIATTSKIRETGKDEYNKFANIYDLICNTRTRTATAVVNDFEFETIYIDDNKIEGKIKNLDIDKIWEDKNNNNEKEDDELQINPLYRNENNFTISKIGEEYIIKYFEAFQQSIYDEWERNGKYERFYIDGGKIVEINEKDDIINGKIIFNIKKYEAIPEDVNDRK